MQKRALAEVIGISFFAGSATMYIVLYNWHQQNLKYAGVVYNIAHEELEALKKRKED